MGGAAPHESGHHTGGPVMDDHHEHGHKHGQSESPTKPGQGDAPAKPPKEAESAPPKPPAQPDKDNHAGHTGKA